MKEKFVVKAKKKELVKFKPIQIYEETHDILSAVVELTGESKAQTLDKMVRFAYANMEVVTDEEGK